MCWCLYCIDGHLLIVNSLIFLDVFSHTTNVGQKIEVFKYRRICGI